MKTQQEQKPQLKGQNINSNSNNNASQKVSTTISPASKLINKSNNLNSEKIKLSQMLNQSPNKKVFLQQNSSQNIAVKTKINPNQHFQQQKLSQNQQTKVEQKNRQQQKSMTQSLINADVLKNIVKQQQEDSFNKTQTFSYSITQQSQAKRLVNYQNQCQNTQINVIYQNNKPDLQQGSTAQLLRNNGQYIENIDSDFCKTYEQCRKLGKNTFQAIGVLYLELLIQSGNVNNLKEIIQILAKSQVQNIDQFKNQNPDLLKLKKNVEMIESSYEQLIDLLQNCIKQIQSKFNAQKEKIVQYFYQALSGINEKYNQSFICVQYFIKQYTAEYMHKIQTQSKIPVRQLQSNLKNFYNLSESASIATDQDINCICQCLQINIVKYSLDYSDISGRHIVQSNFPKNKQNLAQTFPNASVLCFLVNTNNILYGLANNLYLNLKHNNKQNIVEKLPSSQQFNLPLINKQEIKKQQSLFPCSLCNYQQQQQNQLAKSQNSQMFLNKECGHNYCFACNTIILYMQGLMQQYDRVSKFQKERIQCLVKNCPKYLSAIHLHQQLEQMQLDQLKQEFERDEQLLKTENITKRSVECSNEDCLLIDQLIHPADSAPQFYKCHKCKTVKCLVHDQSMQKCMCLCYQCFGETKLLLIYHNNKNDNFNNSESYNIKHCPNCGIVICLVCSSITKLEKQKHVGKLQIQQIDLQAFKCASDFCKQKQQTLQEEKMRFNKKVQEKQNHHHMIKNKLQNDLKQECQIKNDGIDNKIEIEDNCGSEIDQSQGQQDDGENMDIEIEVSDKDIDNDQENIVLQKQNISQKTQSQIQNQKDNSHKINGSLKQNSQQLKIHKANFTTDAMDIDKNTLNYNTNKISNVSAKNHQNKNSSVSNSNENIRKIDSNSLKIVKRGFNNAKLQFFYCDNCRLDFFTTALVGQTCGHYFCQVCLFQQYTQNNNKNENSNQNDQKIKTGCVICNQENNRVKKI